MQGGRFVEICLRKRRTALSLAVVFFYPCFISRAMKKAKITMRAMYSIGTTSEAKDSKTTLPEPFLIAYTLYHMYDLLSRSFLRFFIFFCVFCVQNSIILLTFILFSAIIKTRRRRDDCSSSLFLTGCRLPMPAAFIICLCRISNIFTRGLRVAFSFCLCYAKENG